MISNNNSTQPQVSTLRDSQVYPLEVPPVNPNDPIEVGSGGNGTTSDPPATDRPPGCSDFEYMV